MTAKSLRLQDVLAAVPDEIAALLLRTALTARQTGHTLYLVGGPVRDLLLDRSLVDLDLMVEEDAAGLAEAVAADQDAPALTVVPHPRFKTLRLESTDASLDLATLRFETYAQPGSLPDVEPGTLVQDAQRRDFTVNALLWRVDVANPQKKSPVIDLCGGLDDLQAKRLRVLHPRSFHDDPTRAWRAARFAARLGMTLDRSSRNALRDAIRDGAFGAVSGERYRRELTLAFEEAGQGTHPGRVLRSLADWHVLPALEPGLGIARDRIPPLRRLGRSAASPDWPAPKWRPWIAGLAIWLAPLPAALRRRTLERFSIRGDQSKRIVEFGRTADRTLRSLAKARGRGAVDATLSELPEEAIQALYALAETAVRRRIVRWGAEDRRRRAPVTGSDLVEIGLAGSDIGSAIARIRAGFLDGEIANREEALALAQEIVRRSQQRGASRRAKPRKRKAAAKGQRAKKAKGSSVEGSSSVAGDDSIADTGPRRRKTPSPSDPTAASPAQSPKTDTKLRAHTTQVRAHTKQLKAHTKQPKKSKQPKK